MDRYTSLEQALHDPSLAIISDKIATRKELGTAFRKYQGLSDKQKRFSNYYSYKFLGHDVPEMYVLVKDRLEDDGDLSQNWQLPNETLVISEDDLYYNEDGFNTGTTNICFILGHSGSGKSMMARTLEGPDIDHIELDDLVLVKDHFTKDELKDYSDMLYSFFDGEGAGYYIGMEERENISREEYEDKIFVDFVRFAMAYAKQHRDKRYILDGIWLYLYFDDPSVFKDYAVFIKGTSFLKSKIRVMKREMKRDREELQDRKKMFGREARNYLLDEGKINRYRKFFGDHPLTIRREENNEDSKQSEYVLNALRSIDACFVNDDAAGIKAIRKRAKEEPELSNRDKMKIVSECGLALSELKGVAPATRGIAHP